MSQAIAAKMSQPKSEAVFSLRRWLPLPTILFMIAVTQAPLVITLGFSLERWNLLRPERRKFLGLDNYPDVLSNPSFGVIILNTLVITVSVVVATLVFGLLLALLLNRDFRGKGIVRTMLITPFLIMPTVSAVLWKNVLFNPAFGLLAALAAMFGFERPDVLQDLPMLSVVVVIVWQWTPFMMLILLAGLQSLDHDQIEAAQIDGGGPPVLFRYIVLPHLQRYIELAVLMETLFILSVFGVIFVLTSGGPGIQTTNLSYGIYQEAFQRWDIGEASAMGIFAIILANIVVLVFVRVLRPGPRGRGHRMTRRDWLNRSLTLLTYAIAFALFFPILWMIMTSFKTEADAFAYPPQIIFEPTLDNWQIALFDSKFLDYLKNTLVITLGSTLLALGLGIPAAYALAYYQTKRSDLTLMWLISTRMLPPVGVIVPVFIIFRDLGLRDTHQGLIIIYAAMNLPLVVWMMRSFFLDVPYEILEASRIDGTTLLQEFRYVVIPLALPGLFATALLCLIFAWNEFFFAFNLTVTKAAPVSVYISSFKTAEGLFWAKMSAGATAAVFPCVIAGWVAQRQLVQGLTMGAVK